RVVRLRAAGSAELEAVPFIQEENIMSKYRHALPQLSGGLFVTDGGLETTLVFHDGLDLPAFAAFDLLKDDAGVARLRQYYATYAALATRHGLGLVLETPTWRGNRDWGGQPGYDAAALMY